jgi:hypothetical protein
MKIVRGCVAASALRLTRQLTFRLTLLAALMAGAVGAAYAQQSDSSGVIGNSGSQPGVTGNASNGAGNGAGNGLVNGAGLNQGTSLGPGTGMGPTGTQGAASPAPALNNMRANGTSLNMSPDPRAPNVTGRPAPLR